ncbi:MAG TPA: DUF4091 domain-containing protein [Polyangiaceae bacterium]|nr:MAG: hypothetical protein BWY17_00464 [Deltaproteobacteria bacterium ADurb.Bin207]HNS96088.1 DUF4091 domain-containing protein [Polyangiaceae bacterium]HNZ20908.1 DUF4091 domain-containing protein [Polyangiaceae bacterium]HOD21481.1 DUF4091 domain-containing protein [Polyangiaceae bacterium]HOE47589.1 DUF4091 domain-containing protein [Polyangiaceae bacterium]
MTYRWSALVGLLFLTLSCCKKKGVEDVPLPPPAKPIEKQLVWVVDDGERVARHAGALPWMAGENNAVWKPGQPIRLFGLPGETIAFQVVVTAASERIESVTVDLDELSGPVTIKNDSALPATSFRPIERFVVHELEVKRRSGGKVKGESLGWKASSMPEDPSRDRFIPDPLIPIEVAPSWANYPMIVNPGEHRVVWIDITLPTTGLPAGSYRGSVEVRSSSAALASIPVDLEVGSVALPYAAVATMVYVEPDRGIASRMGSRKAVDHLFQLMHRHHLSTVFPITEPEDVQTYRLALTGELYTEKYGYHGPGMGKSASVIVLGAYGGYGDPSPTKLENIKKTLEALEGLGLRDEPLRRDIFLYAADEQCESPTGPGWRKLLKHNNNPLLRSLRVGHTCSESPTGQQVDLVMMIASAYDPSLVQQARSMGKHVWIYNGELPHTGTFLTDGWYASLRANAWIQQKYDIERWFYWESTFWTDGNRGGHGPYDPLLWSETFHNAQGDHCNGDGVLVYPGKQVVEGYRTLGFDGVLSSIRLKQWRRGISDAGYLQLVQKIDRETSDRIMTKMIPGALQQVSGGIPLWPREGAAWTEARRELFDKLRK